MKSLTSTLITGMAVGLIFNLMGLPIPAPPALAGVVGILGVYFGFISVDAFRSFQKEDKDGTDMP